MSTLKTNAAQIGQSVTATNNFTLYQPASPDGTVRLGQGNAGSVTDKIIIAANGVGFGGISPLGGGTSNLTSIGYVTSTDGGYFSGGAYWDTSWKNSVNSQGGWAIRNSSGSLSIMTGPSPGVAGTSFTDFSDRLIIDTLGRVTKPSQPKFYVYGGSGTASGTVIWNNVQYNVGNCYSTSTGKFTAPVNGYYLIGNNMFANGAVGSTYQFNWSGADDSEQKGSVDAAGYSSAFTMKIIYMAANDTIWVSANNGGYLVGKAYSNFFGMLIS